MRFFPYEPRKGQEEVVRLVGDAIAARKHLVVEAGTGSGKTVTVLSAALEKAVEHDLRVLYTTRTNSQQRQALLEFRAIRPKMGLPRQPLALGAQGRANFCPKMRVDPKFEGATAEELSKLCSDAKKKTIAVREANGNPLDEAKACAWYHGLLEAEPGALDDFARGLAPTPDEFAAGLEERGVCPYEAVKVLLPDALLVVAPYAYVFDARLRRAMMDRLGVTPGEVILVVDEAHNLPEWAREAMSAKLTGESLHRARNEALERGNPSLGPFPALQLLAALEDAMEAVAAEFIDGEGGEAAPRPGDDDALVPPSALEAELMSRLRCTSNAIGKACEALVAVGATVQEERRRRGELPRSHLHALAAFLLAWMSADSAEYAKLVTRFRGKATLEIFALDPGLATRACLDFAATIHMSGTLRPLDQYRDAVGLPRDTKMATMPSPFPPGNLEVIIADDVTTRWESLQRDAAMADRLHEAVVGVANATSRNTAVFYPSYAMLRGALDAGLRQEIGRRVLVDDRELSRGELGSLLEAFRAAGRDKGAVLLSVMGGRVAEGIDFPAEQLEVAVLVGLPYARPSAKQRALVNYYDLKFGRGWEYANEAPMLRKVVQGIGRLIRTPTDRALAVLLDSRGLKFKGRLPGSREVAGDALPRAVLEWSNRRGTVVRKESF